ncbi:MAG: acyl carrier protein [Myxococcota bacterium]
MNDLGLAGDGDEVELIQEIEATFGISLTAEDLAQSPTVGDLYRLAERPVGPRHCSTAAAFFRMRAVVDRPGFTPDVALRSIVGPEGYGRWRRTMAARTGLRFPTGPLPLWRFMLLGVCATAPLMVGWPGMLAWLGIPILLHRAEQPVASTVGGLARAVGQASFGRITSGPAHATDVWEALVAAIRRSTGHEGPVRPTTRWLG